MVLALVSLNYPAIDSFLGRILSSNQEVFVERIIDGDTVESSIGNVRLLGINTPERGEKYYPEAKEFLSSMVFNKTVMLEYGKERRDKYNRTLAYIFLDGKNINIDMVKNGFANYYFYDGRDKYSDALEDAWGECIEKKINLCELSSNQCSSCITVNPSFVINNCAVACNITAWQIKGEGREKFIFNQTILQKNEKISFVLDITNSSRSLFLRDEEGNLVLWKKA